MVMKIGWFDTWNQYLKEGNWVFLISWGDGRSSYERLETQIRSFRLYRTLVRGKDNKNIDNQEN